ncbi:hypothetical protein E1283_19355 [Streptomyces hainanensis]|uniref:Uncharacterized protein n=1 Tax=Streptomyces hainanensis TaxID=402648 RepID=A0A4R4T876_9ACTN|nr:hypothetical protein E1283_19355 [Streptomyces hainanensis]
MAAAARRARHRARPLRRDPAGRVARLARRRTAPPLAGATARQMPDGGGGAARGAGGDTARAGRVGGAPCLSGPWPPRTPTTSPS